MTALDLGAEVGLQKARHAAHDSYAAYYYYGSKAARATRARRRGARFLTGLVGAACLISFLVVGVVAGGLIVVTAAQLLPSH